MSYLGGVNGLNLAENRIEYILLQPEIFSQRTVLGPFAKVTVK